MVVFLKSRERGFLIFWVSLGVVLFWGRGMDEMILEFFFIVWGFDWMNF